MKRMTMVAATTAMVGVFVLAAGCCGMKSGKCGGGSCPVGGKGEVAACPVLQKGVAVVNTDALKALHAGKAPLVLLDARSGKFDDGRRIPGALALNAGSADTEIAKVLPDKSALIVTYCAGVKCPASAQLAEKLHKLGYTNVIEYPEGIAGWVEAGNPVDELKK